MYFNTALFITYTRIVLTPLFMYLVFKDLQFWAIFVFVIASGTDFFDGYIARKTNSATIFGAIMDPIADKFLITSALIALVEKGLLSSWIVVLIIFREYFISGLRIFASQRNISISAHFSGKVKTVLQMSMIISLIAQYQYAFILVYLTLILTIYSGIEYTIKYTRTLKKGSIDDKLKEVHKLLLEKGLTISVCESCTGGLLGSYLSKLPKSSNFFKGGIISYMSQIKEKVLGISKDLIEEKGVVSKEVAELMCKNTREIFESDISVSITGLAGPTPGDGKDREKPIGLVYIGLINNKGYKKIQEFLFKGDRESIRKKACESALSMIKESLEKEM